MSSASRVTKIINHALSHIAVPPSSSLPLSSSSVSARTVYLALSGGVDSSVAGWLLRERGYIVKPVFLRCWDIPVEHDHPSSFRHRQRHDDDIHHHHQTSSSYAQAPPLSYSSPCFERELRNAEAACRALNIDAADLRVVDLVSEYWTQVFENVLLNGLANGQTPNPDLACNKYIKFDAFPKRLAALLLATTPETETGRLQGEEDCGDDLQHTQTQPKEAQLKKRRGSVASSKSSSTQRRPRSAPLPSGVNVKVNVNGDGDNINVVDDIRIATGHYARLRTTTTLMSVMDEAVMVCSEKEVDSNVNGQTREVTQLLCGIDPIKDQSYFLASVSCDALSRFMMPLGVLTKSDVRAIASHIGLPAAKQRSSRGLCFVANGSGSGNANGNGSDVRRDENAQNNNNNDKDQIQHTKKKQSFADFVSQFLPSSSPSSSLSSPSSSTSLHGSKSHNRHDRYNRDASDVAEDVSNTDNASLLVPRFTHARSRLDLGPCSSPAWAYTVGQRARIPGQSSRLFVAGACQRRHRVMVVPHDDPWLFTRRFVCPTVDWVCGYPPVELNAASGGGMQVEYKPCSTAQRRKAVIQEDEDGEREGGIVVEPERGWDRRIGEGQAVVLYQGDVCLGAAWPRDSDGDREWQWEEEDDDEVGWTHNKEREGKNVGKRDLCVSRDEGRCSRFECASD